MKYNTASNNRIYFNLYFLSIIIGGAFFVFDLMMERFTELPSIFISIHTSVAFLLLIKNRFHSKNIHVLYSLFVLFLLLYCVFQSDFCLNTVRVAITLCGLFFLGLYYMNHCPNFKDIYKILFGLTILLVIYAFLQGLYLLPSFNRIYSITGPFDNPAGIAMTLSLLLPYTFYLYKDTTVLNGKILIAFVISATCITILFSGSRTGMVASLFVVIYLFFAKWKYYVKILIGVFLPIVFFMIYLLKPLSAQGRAFISANCLSVIYENFCWGNGVYGFSRHYMSEQANYFKAHTDSPWHQLADNVSFPYNEFFGWVISWGVVGLILVIALIAIAFYISIVYVKNEKHYAQASVGAFLVCSCFSYPLRYPIIQVLLTLSICILISIHFDSKEKLIGSFGRKIAMEVMVIITFIGLLVISCYQGYYELKWKEVVDKAASNEDGSSLLSDYRKLNSNLYLYTHPYFLYNYAAVLHEQGLHQESLIALAGCERRLNNYDVQLLKANNYKDLKIYDKSIHSFTEASYMIPLRLIPLYELMRIYNGMGDKRKAYKLAIKINCMPVKVNSYEAGYIKSEINNYLLKNEQEGGYAYDVE